MEGVAVMLARFSCVEGCFWIQQVPFLSGLRLDLGVGSLVFSPNERFRLSRALLIFLNSSPCNGLVRMSAIISVVDRYTMSMSFASILS